MLLLIFKSSETLKLFTIEVKFCILDGMYWVMFWLLLRIWPRLLFEESLSGMLFNWFSKILLFARIWFCFKLFTLEKLMSVGDPLYI